ncbi:iron-containing redox enzyme family protein [Parashewanella spongiae]|uniref:Iron-containing redox enzyme family protein n=1 Tax=Parashewanella spongiae TaxID=342950 RepID=A0A3A6U8H4_9GAMM|nr:iron-containing redox enzyme family protein [Parashewanella spongiae]MCL1078668.1 iron-containing redox enzyme family protein [Parashewanella spongiae]RJY12958.1 iron-containing redox enzyme family protein [Parashewanella spongiae]
MNDILKKFDKAGIGIRQRKEIALSTKSYLDNILAQIAKNRAVEHPFLNHYRTHMLTKSQERRLYCECFYFFRYLPFYIAGMANNTTDERILREISFNVTDEVGRDPTHSTLYRQFMEDIDISYENIENYKPLDVTLRLNQGIRKLYTDSPIICSLGALYADETMSTIMVGKLNDGLINQGYDESVRHFWQLHINLEVGHSNSIFNAVAPYVDSDEYKYRQEFELGVYEFLQLVEDFWDGVGELIAKT